MHIGEMVTDMITSGTVTDINRDVAATLRLCGPAMLMQAEGTVVPEVSYPLLPYSFLSPAT